VSTTATNQETLLAHTEYKSHRAPGAAERIYCASPENTNYANWQYSVRANERCTLPEHTVKIKKTYQEHLTKPTNHALNIQADAKDRFISSSVAAFELRQGVQPKDRNSRHPQHPRTLGKIAAIRANVNRVNEVSRKNQIKYESTDEYNLLAFNNQRMKYLAQVTNSDGPSFRVFRPKDKGELWHKNQAVSPNSMFARRPSS